MSMIGDFIYKKTNRYPLALPEHLRNWKGTGKVRLHDDWPPILRMIPRSYNANGPRAIGAPGYAPWPPRLREGKGIARWENAGATSIIYIPSLESKIITQDFYGTKIKAWETVSGNPNFGKEGWVHITWKLDDLGPGMYSPSALQRWSPKGYLKMNPTYWAWWKVLKKKEDPFKSTLQTGENKVAFLRNGWRPDHLDIYYNNGPMAGLQQD